MGWSFDVGPLHMGSEGVGVRPQMKVGYADDNVKLAAGLDDVRDGISGGVMGRVHRKYTAEGNSMKEVLTKLKNESEIKILDDVIRAAPQLLSQIIKMTGVDIPSNSHIAARCILKIGLGVSGGVCLGWADTRGFHMVGCRGSVSAAASIGADIMAGLHHTRKFVKAILGISNICVEMVFELPEPAKTGKAGVEGETAPPEVIKETVAAGDAQREELGVEKPPADAVQPEDVAEVPSDAAAVPSEQAVEQGGTL